MAIRQVEVGNDIILRALFTDEFSTPVEATNVLVYIFEPGANTNNLFEAINYASPAVPIYNGNGVFELTYSIPSNGTEGAWNDVWVGEILGTSTSATFTFSVTNRGSISTFEEQLYPNNIITITISKDIVVTDGSTLPEDYTFTFLTTTNPSYSNVRKVRLDFGGFLTPIPDDTLQQIILESSIEADRLTFSKIIRNKKLYDHAIREWVTFKTGLTLLSNIQAHLTKGKKLGDFDVLYDTNGIRDVLNRALDMLDKWEPQIMSGGGALEIEQPLMAIKGNNDPDRPMVGRTWDERNTGIHDWPAANIEKVPRGHRRARSGYDLFRKKYWIT
jgi:hypothetical protein